MKALTKTQTSTVTTRLSLGTQFLQDLVNENPEIWENSKFRCAIDMLVDANAICHNRVYPMSSKELPTRKWFGDIAWNHKIGKVTT